VAEVTFDRKKLTATVTMKDANTVLSKRQAEKALLAKGERFRIDSFKQKR